MGREQLIQPHALLADRLAHRLDVERVLLHVLGGGHELLLLGLHADGGRAPSLGDRRHLGRRRVAELVRDACARLACHGRRRVESFSVSTVLGKREVRYISFVRNCVVARDSQGPR